MCKSISHFFNHQLRCQQSEDVICGGVCSKRRFWSLRGNFHSWSTSILPIWFNFTHDEELLRPWSLCTLPLVSIVDGCCCRQLPSILKINHTTVLDATSWFWCPQKSFLPASGTPTGPAFSLPKICSNTTMPIYRREIIKTVLGDTFSP